MSRQVQVPINEFDYFTSDGTYVGVKFKYRIKEDVTDNDVSQWSEVKELIFKDSDNKKITLSEANGYEAPTSVSRATPINSLTLDVSGSDTPKMMPSQIDQIISQNNLASGFMPVPENDLYRLSWITPEKFNVGKYDIFQSWRGVAYVHPTADVTAPVVSGANYTGTLSFSGGNSTIRAQTLKSYYDWYELNVSADLPTYATQGTSVPGNNLLITGYSGASNFNLKSANTWTASGNFTNISRINAFTEPEYFTTTETNRLEFSRKNKSNKVSATIIEGSCVIQLNENIATSGIVPGMKLVKISGDGAFSPDVIISQIDYQNNRIIVSTVDGQTTTVSTGGTIGPVTSSAGVWSATITGMTASSTQKLEPGYMIYATAGTPGTFGNGIIRVASIVSGTSMTVTSNKTFTAGAITNIVAPTKDIVDNTTNHISSGYIEFVGDASTQFDISYSGSTVKHNYLTQIFCQAIISASTKDKDWSNLYTLLSVSENQLTYNSGLGKITNSSGTTKPYTAVITGMGISYQASPNAAGLRIYANPTTTGPGSFGSGEVKVARYDSGNSIEIVSTAQITNGFVYGIRL